MVNQMCVTRPLPFTSIRVKLSPGSILRKSAFRPLGSLLEARAAVKPFLEARSDGTWPRTAVGNSAVISAAAKIRARGIVVVLVFMAVSIERDIVAIIL